MLSLFTTTNASLISLYQFLTDNHVGDRISTHNATTKQMEEAGISYLKSQGINVNDKIEFDHIVQLTLEIVRNIFDGNTNDIIYIDEECAKLISLTQFISVTDENHKQEFHLFLCYLISWFIVIKYKILTKQTFTSIYHKMLKQNSAISISNLNCFDDCMKNIPNLDNFDFNRLKFKYYHQTNEAIYKILETHFNYIQDLVQNVFHFLECDWYYFCYDVSLLMHIHINQYKAYKSFFFVYVLREIVLFSDISGIHLNDSIIYEMEKLMLNVIINIDNELHHISLADSVKKFCFRYAKSCRCISNVDHFLGILLQINYVDYNENKLQELLSDLFKYGNNIDEEHYRIELCDNEDLKLLNEAQCNTLIKQCEEIFEYLWIRYNLLQNIDNYVYMIHDISSLICMLHYVVNFKTINVFFEHIYPKYIAVDSSIYTNITLQQLKNNHYPDFRGAETVRRRLDSILQRDDITQKQNVRQFRDIINAIDC